MSRPFRAAALFALAAPAGLAAQRPDVSPVLPRVWQRDTTLTIWLFVRPAVPLDEAAQRVAAAGARVRGQSRWLHAIGADVPTPALRQLARESLFRRIQPAARWRRPPSPEPVSLAPVQLDTCPAGGDPDYGPSEMPYRQLDIRPLSDRGYDGAGVRIAILDAGFNTLDPAFAGVTVTAQYDFVFGDTVVRNQPNDSLPLNPAFHGTAVWSLFAGLVPGRLRGIARGASYLVAKTEDVRSETRIEEINYVRALEWADSIGVDIVSSSLGYLTFDDGFSYRTSELNGRIAVTSVAAESAAARGILVVTAAGNDGPGFRTLVTPGDADSVITVGAEDSLGVADGRLKPDLTAPGQAVCVLAGPNTVRRFSGTSFATPLTAASAALVKQLHPTLGPLALRRALAAYATNRATPDSLRGWGRPDVAATATFPTGVTPLTPVGPVLTSVTPDFTWSAGNVPPVAAPVTYRLRIARDSALASPLVDTVLTDLASYSLRQALKPGRPLFWRVDGTSASGVPATTGLVGPITVSPWATLTSLSGPGGVNTIDVQPTFTWRSPAISAPLGPFRYDLIVHRAAAELADIPAYSVVDLTDTLHRLLQPLERNSAYRCSLVVHAASDTSLVRSEVFLVLDPSLPPTTLLYQNFPNPFPAGGRDSTCIWFDLPAAGRVELAILDLRGNPVRRFVPGPDFPEMLPAGRYGQGGPGSPTCDPKLMWDGRADDGRELPAGVYLYKLKAGGVILFRRIVFRGRKR